MSSEMRAAIEFGIGFLAQAILRLSSAVLILLCIALSIDALYPWCGPLAYVFWIVTIPLFPFAMFGYPWAYTYFSGESLSALMMGVWITWLVLVSLRAVAYVILARTRRVS